MSYILNVDALCSVHGRTELTAVSPIECKEAIKAYYATRHKHLRVQSIEFEEHPKGIACKVLAHPHGHPSKTLTDTYIFERV